MAAAATKSPQRTRKGRWTVEETDELFDLLDHLVTSHHYGVESREAKKTLLQELHKRWKHRKRSSRHNRCNVKSIERKLSSEAALRGRPGDRHAYYNLLNFGTASFKRRKPDARLEMCDARKRLRKDRPGPSKPQEAGSQKTELSATPKASTRKEPRAKRVLSSESCRGTRSGLTLRSWTSESSSLSSAPQQSRIENSSASPSPLPSSKQLWNITPAIEYSSVPNHRTLRLGPVPKDEVIDTGTGKSHEDTTPLGDYWGLPDYSEPGADDQKKSLSEAPILRGGRKLLGGLLTDNAYYQRALESSESELKVLKELDRPSMVNDSILLIREMNQLSHWQEQLRKSGLFRDAQSKVENKYYIDKIRKSFDEMGQKCITISSGYDFQYPKPTSCGGLEDTARLLRAAVFEDDLSENDRPALAFKSILRQVRKALPADQIVHCLLGISIQKWVFKPTLQCLEMTSTSILKHYKDQILNFGGELALRNIEYQAHRSLIEDQHFQKNFLIAEAEHLAKRFLNVLRPFLPEFNEEGGENEVDREEMLQDLRLAYRYGLEVKMWSICCTSLFDVVWPYPDSSIPDEMVKTVEQVRSGDGHGGRRWRHVKVKMPLMPGIRQYPSEERPIDYCSFNVSGRQGLGVPELLRRATVVLHDI